MSPILNSGQYLRLRDQKNLLILKAREINKVSSGPPGREARSLGKPVAALEDSLAHRLLSKDPSVMRKASGGESWV
jgi:hypothetical protein